MQTIQWNSEGTEFHGFRSDPQGDIKAVICLVHGMGEHSGRYLHVADFFNRSGYAFIALDNRGHGKSGGKRGHTPDYETLMNDVSAFLSQAASCYPGKKLFLYGHSMGGNLVLNYGIRRSSEVAGIIASAPYLTLAFDPPKWKTGLASVVNGLLPGLTQPTGLDASHLSVDPEVVAAYRKDPLVHDKMSVAFFMNVHFAGPYAIDKAADIKVPALVLHGTGDKITAHKGSEAFVRNSGGKSELKLWPGLYHEIHNEPNKGEVLEFILHWIEKQL